MFNGQFAVANGAEKSFTPECEAFLIFSREQGINTFSTKARHVFRMQPTKVIVPAIITPLKQSRQVLLRPLVRGQAFKSDWKEKAANCRANLS